MNEVNDSVRAEKPECEIRVCDDPRSWKRQAQIEENRAQELMETCDKFYHENQLLKGLFAREYCSHETDLSILKDTDLVVAEGNTNNSVYRVIDNNM